MFNQPIALPILLFWIILNLLSFVLSLRLKLTKQPPLNKTKSALIIFFEALAILLALVQPSFENKYLIFLGFVLLIEGWIVSNNHIFISVKGNRWLARFRDGFFHLLGIEKDFYYRAVSGDWMQLIGLSAIFGSFYGIGFALVIFPVVVHFATISLMPKRLNTTNPYELQPSNSFVLPSSKFFYHLIFTLIGLTLFLAIYMNDITLFSGNLRDARSLLEMLVQTEATIFAVGLTFFIAVSEFTNVAYTPRLSKFIFNLMSFKFLGIVSIASIVLKIMVLVKENYFSSTWIDWSLFFSITFVVSITLFVFEVLSFMRPETLVAESLKQFDVEWLKIINNRWNSISKPKTIYIESDPLIPIERILVSALNNRDLITFSTGLIQIGEKITYMSNEINKIALDNYLAARLEPVISTASKNSLDWALESLCYRLVELTKPPLDSLRNAETRGIRYAPGCNLLMKILDASIEAKLSDSMHKGLILTSQRTSYAINALPAFSDVWIANPKNFERIDIDQALSDEFFRNDLQIANFQSRYLGYFMQISKRSIDLNLTDFASESISLLCYQIINITEHIPEEAYQEYLITHILLDIDGFVHMACDKKYEEQYDMGFCQQTFKK